jgi:hypothetical protein
MHFIVVVVVVTCKLSFALGRVNLDTELTAAMTAAKSENAPSATAATAATAEEEEEATAAKTPGE